jgi:hypothetical protein
MCRNSEAITRLKNNYIKFPDKNTAYSKTRTGLDWTGKTRTGLRLVKRGLDSISKTRTGLY